MRRFAVAGAAVMCLGVAGMAPLAAAPAVRVTASFPSSVTVGAKVTVVGRASGRAAAELTGTCRVQTAASGGWSSLATARVRAGVCRVPVVFRAAGNPKVRLLLRPAAGAPVAAGTTAPRTIQVREATPPPPPPSGGGNPYYP
jgi:hypothetical protein